MTDHNHLYDMLYRRLSEWADARRESYDGKWDRFKRILNSEYKNSYNELDSNDEWRSEQFINITRQKKNAAISQIDEALYSEGKFPFEVTITPEGDTSHSISKRLKAVGFENEDIVAVIRKRIDDRLIQSKSYREVRKAWINAIDYGVGVLKSPHESFETINSWVTEELASIEQKADELRDEEGELSEEAKEKIGAFIASNIEVVRTRKERRTFGIKSIRPMDFFPDPSCNGDAQDGIGVFERKYITKSDLAELANEKEIDENGKEKPQYDEDAIMSAISGKGEASYSSGGMLSTSKDKIELYTYWGKIDAHSLGEDVDAISAYQTIDVRVDFIKGGHVLRVSKNTSPMGTRPYHLFHWESVSDEWGGRGLAEKLEPLQIDINRLARNYIDNKVISSQLMFGVVNKHLDPSEDFSIYPGKIFNIREGKRVSDSMQPFTTPDNSDAFRVAIEFLKDLADAESGVPNILESASQIRGQTAFEAQQREAHANKQLGKVIRNIDEGIEDALNSIYEYMQNDASDLDARLGDYHIHAKGYASYEAKRLRLAQVNSILSRVLQVPQLETYYNIRELITAELDVLGMDSSKYIYSDDEIREALKDRAEQQSQQLQAKSQEQAQSMQSEFERSIELEKIKGESKIRTEQMRLEDKNLDREQAMKLKLMELEENDAK